MEKIIQSFASAQWLFDNIFLVIVMFFICKKLDNLSKAIKISAFSVFSLYSFSLIGLVALCCFLTTAPSQFANETEFPMAKFVLQNVFIALLPTLIFIFLKEGRLSAWIIGLYLGISHALIIYTLSNAVMDEAIVLFFALYPLVGIGLFLMLPIIYAVSKFIEWTNRVSQLERLS